MMGGVRVHTTHLKHWQKSKEQDVKVEKRCSTANIKQKWPFNCFATVFMQTDCFTSTRLAQQECQKQLWWCTAGESQMHISCSLTFI